MSWPARQLDNETWRALDSQIETSKTDMITGNHQSSTHSLQQHAWRHIFLPSFFKGLSERKRWHWWMRPRRDLRSSWGRSASSKPWGGTRGYTTRRSPVRLLRPWAASHGWTSTGAAHRGWSQALPQSTGRFTKNFDSFKKELQMTSVDPVEDIKLTKE